MRLLVTRPDEDAGSLVELLAEMGHEAVSAPLMEIRLQREVKIPDTPYQAILITSANGARAIGQRLEIARLRNIPVLAVGGASAEASREAGFRDVEAAGGDVTSLVDLALRRLEPGAGPLLHAAGSVVAGDLKGDLEARGFSVDRVILYEAIAAEHMPEAASEALKSETLSGVLLYSPRTARIFSALVREAGLEDRLRPLAAYCLSQAVAEGLAGLPFARVHVAREPSQAALLELLEPEFRPG